MNISQENKFSQIVQKEDGSALLQLMDEGYSFADAVLSEKDIKKLSKKGLKLFRENEDLNKIIAFLLEVVNACYDQALYLYAQKLNGLVEELLDTYLETDNSEFMELKSRYLKLGARVGWDLMAEEDARKSLDGARLIQEKLLKREPGNYRYLKELGDLHKYLGDFRADEFLEHYRRYFEIAKGLTERYPDDNSIRDYYSIAIERMGGQDKQSGDYQSAEQKFLQYMDIQEDLHKRDPEHPKFLNCLSVAYGRLAGINLTIGNYEKAEAFYKKQVSILSRLYAMYPRRKKYKANFAKANSSLSKLYIDMAEYDEALEYIAESYRLWNEIKDVSQNPWDDIQSYYYVFETYGYIYWKIGDAEESRKYFDQFLEHAEQLHKRFPDIWSIKDDVGRAYQHIGGYYFGQEEYAEALENFKRFRDISKERFDENDGKYYHNNYAFSLDKMAGVYNAQFKHKEAEELYKEEVRIREELCSLYPKNQYFRDLLGLACYHRGTNAVVMEAHDIAQNALEEAHSIMKEIHDAGQKDYSSLLQHIEESMAILARLSGRIPSHTVEMEVAEVEADRKILDNFVQHLNNEKDAKRYTRKTWDLLMELEDMCEEHEDDFDKNFYEELLELKLQQCAFLIESEFLSVFEVFKLGVICEYDAKDSYEKRDDQLEALEIALKAYRRKKEDGEDDRMLEKIEKVKKMISELG